MSKSPIKRFKSGPVTASVWENEGQFGRFYAVTLNRYYQNDGDATYTNSLTADSLLHAKKVLGLAEKYIDACKQRPAKRTRHKGTNGEAVDRDMNAGQSLPSNSPPANEVVPTDETPASEESTSDDLDSYV